MSDDLQQALRDALALTTSLLHAKSESLPWDDTLRLAREFAGAEGADVLMAEAHLLTQLLQYATDIAKGAESAGVEVAGIPGGTTPENLLREFGRQMLGE